MPDIRAVRDPSSGPAGSRQQRRQSSSFVCSASTDGLDAAWVRVAGEVDIASTPKLDRMLREFQREAQLVVLDLRDVAFMDSSGVHVIVDASIRAREAVRRLVLLRPPPGIDRMFALTGASEHLEIGDINPAEPPVQVLLQLAEQEHAP